MRKLTFSLYLTVLAVSDTIAMYSGPLKLWIRHLTDVDIASSSPGLCKFSVFMEYASADISAWTLVVLTTQRFVSVWFPIQSRTMCTMKISTITVVASIVVCTLKNSHFLISRWSLDSDSATYNGGSVYFGCTTLDPSYTYILLVIWPNIDMTIAAFLPFAIILCCNALIIYRMTKRQKINEDRHITSHNAAKKVKGMSVMLLIMSFAFLVLQMPLFIYLIGEVHWKAGEDGRTIARIQLGRAIVDIFYYSSYATNFFLYCLGGAGFRKELKRLFSCIHGNRVSESSMEPNVSVVDSNI